VGGIAEASGWQVGTLYDLACETYARLGQPLEVLRLRRAQHERMPSLSTYTTLQTAAEEVHAWDVERDAARMVLRACDVRGFVGALLGDGDQDLAWDEAVAAPADEVDAELWLRLAESREVHQPDDALAVYRRVADEVLVETDRRAYARAVRILKHAHSVADAAGHCDDFTAHSHDCESSTGDGRL
jgi:uncharacterized Zn finger protein